MDRRSTTLLSLLLFNALTAITGGLALITGLIEYAGPLKYTEFNNLYFPGVILMAIVGGSALIAAIALVKRLTGWQLASVASAVIMLLWILGEVASIRTFHFLQIIYIVTAVTVIWYVPEEKR